MVNTHTGRSAWAKGVAVYAHELINELETNMRNGSISPAVLGSVSELTKAMLNGAKNWEQYSEGGLALCYNHDIAERLCTPCELRKTRHGEKAPNARESWIDVQSRALYQASLMVLYARPNMITIDEVEV
jgi:hypothetical protein